MLGRVASENQKDWCTRLPFIIAAYRAARHESTGYSPNFIVYGQELAAPIDIVLGRPDGTEYRSMDHFVEMKLRLMEEAHETVRQQLRLASARSKRRYDLDVKFREFSVGSWVWFYSPRRYVGRSPKWQRNYSGPFLVVRRLSPVLYVIQKSRRSKEILTHADKLKAFLGAAPISWINSTDPSYPTDKESEDNIPDAELPIPEPLFGEEINSPAAEITVVSEPTPPGPVAEESSLSPDALEFRPKRQIRIPVRYRDE